jgi:dienelactone hydrolase
VQGHFAESDPTCPPDIVAGLEKSLGEAGVTVEFFTYPTDDPRFFDEDGDTARQAWIRTLEFLRKHLG